jgi:hypothetical protein
VTPTPISVLQGTKATPLTFVLNGTGDLTLESVTADVDGSGAATAFDAVLSLYTQDGRLISRTKPTTSIAAGGEAIVTWAPFLRKPAVAAAGSTLNAIHLYTGTPLTIVNVNDGRISFDSVSSFNSAVFGTQSSGGRIIRVTLKKAGWYSYFGTLDWTTTPGVGYTNMYHIDGLDTLSTYGITHQEDPNTHLYTHPELSFTRHFPATLGFGDTLPVNIEWWVGQNSGGNLVTLYAAQEWVYLGESDF